MFTRLPRGFENVYATLTYGEYFDTNAPKDDMFTAITTIKCEHGSDDGSNYSIYTRMNVDNHAANE